MAKVEKEAILNAYMDVRDDNSDATWAVLKYDGSSIIVEGTGKDYDDFLQSFSDDERKYGFIRVVTGDELSKRFKFVFITWCGNDVTAMKKAKMSVDKSIVKDIMSSFAVEMLVSEFEELKQDYILNVVRKAGGANYGTGAN